MKPKVYHIDRREAYRLESITSWEVLVHRVIVLKDVRYSHQQQRIKLAPLLLRATQSTMQQNG
jgi:hypothetical protein